MAKFPEPKEHDEDTTSWLYTALGIGIILCIGAFIGLAQPPVKTPIENKEISTIPKYQDPLGPKVKSNLELQKLPPSSGVDGVNHSRLTPVELPNFPGNPLEDTGLFISLPFGGDARERCSSSCEEDLLCLQSCQRLLPVNFARRILPVDPDHSKLAAQSVESCKEASFINPILGAQRVELKMLLTPVDYYEESEIFKKLNEVTLAMQNLTNSKKADPLAEAVCYYQGSLVASLAVAKSAKSRDSVSELTYRQYESVFVVELQKKLQEIRG